MISVGKDKTKVDLKYFRLGKDLLVIITGGDAHIGAVTLSEEGCTQHLVKGVIKSVLLLNR